MEEAYYFKGVTQERTSRVLETENAGARLCPELSVLGSVRCWCHDGGLTVAVLTDRARSDTRQVV